jgi:hypothetical protein
MRITNGIIQRTALANAVPGLTTQQLSYASSVLAEMENRLAELGSVLDPTAFGVLRLTEPTAGNAAARQSVADEIFGRETGDGRRETGDGKRETGNGKREK